jgi:hypothetical protein
VRCRTLRARARLGAQEWARRDVLSRMASADAERSQRLAAVRDAAAAAAKAEEDAVVQGEGHGEISHR